MTTALDMLPAVVRADAVRGPVQGQWTYADYAALPDDGHRYEIVDGVLYMAPAPNVSHQATQRWFVFYLTTYVQLSGAGFVYPAPCDVELTPDVVVQPDVVVVLKGRQEIIKPSRIIGPPDLVIEIASPGTAGYDRREKHHAYARAGVHEYWIADPAAQTIEVQRLAGGAYRLVGVYQGKAMLPSEVIAHLPVHVEQFFA